MRNMARTELLPDIEACRIELILRYYRNIFFQLLIDLCNMNRDSAKKARDKNEKKKDNRNKLCLHN